MDILYLLIPMSVVLVALIVAAFLWAIRSGQFDDLEGPAHRILLDRDDRPEPPASEKDPPTTGNRAPESVDRNQ